MVLVENIENKLTIGMCSVISITNCLMHESGH